jgi:hypothetical protein
MLAVLKKDFFWRRAWATRGKPEFRRFLHSSSQEILHAAAFSPARQTHGASSGRQTLFAPAYRE